MDDLDKLRTAHNALKDARETLNRIIIYRRGGIAYESRRQLANLGESKDMTVQNIETAMRLIVEVGRALKNKV
jgi:hypothetical protein